MKIVVRSSSLVFALACITLNAPIARVKRKAETPPKKPTVREQAPQQWKFTNRAAS